MFYYIFLILVLIIPLRNIALKFPLLFNINGFSVTNILYGCVLLGTIFIGKSTKPRIYHSKLALPLILYVVYFFAQIFLNPGSHSYSFLFTWWKDSFLFMLIPYFFVTRTISSSKKLLLILVVMCIANIYMDTYFWRWVRWMNFNNFTDKMKSVNGTFGGIGGCNEWAAFFSTYTLVLITTLKSFKKKWLRIGVTLLTVANVLVLMFTFSRGGYAGFLIGLFYLFVKTKKYLLITLFILFTLLYTIILPQAVVERVQMSFQSTPSTEVADQDVESRLVMWTQAIKIIINSPILGNGLFSFKYKHWDNPHNQHLNMLVQGGIIGYGLFLWLFIASFKEAKYLFKIGQNSIVRSFGVGMCAAIVSLCVANLFGDRWSYYVITGYFWVFNGMVYVLINQAINAPTDNTVSA